MKPTSWKPFLLPPCAYALLILLSLFSASNTQSQEVPFVPCTQDSVKLAGIYTQYETVYKTDLKALPTQYQKDYETIYKQRWTSIKHRFDEKEIHMSPEAQQYLDALVAEIVRNNTILQGKHFKCYFSRSGVPNASYIGHGILLLNMGLFYRLQDESEAAFVLSHEIAHYLLNHSERAIAKYVTTVNSEEMQAQLKKLKKQEYGRGAEVEKLSKALAFDSRRHGRDRESEADSMAVELLRNTRFDVNGALSALALLDVIDKDSFDTETCLQKTFNATQYPFQKKWIAKETGLLSGHAELESENKAEEDSLKTHPDCQKRIAALTPLVNRYSKAGSARNIIDPARFTSLQQQFPYEIIAYAYSSKHYSSCLYYTLNLLEKKPTDAYLITQVGQLFNGIYTAQKTHTLNRVADLPGPDHTAGYNALLQFLQNLYLENIANINYYFLTSHQSQAGSYKSFHETWTTSKQLAAQ